MWTLNLYFAIALKKTRLQRFQTEMKTVNSYPSPSKREEPLVRIQDVIDTNTSNEDKIVENLVNTLQSYCKVAWKQFVDAATKGAADYLLLVVNNGPLSVFSLAFGALLSAGELDRIAGEASATSQTWDKRTT